VDESGIRFFFLFSHWEKRVHKVVVLFHLQGCEDILQHISCLRKNEDIGEELVNQLTLPEKAI
jgi:hypothetical protein